VRTIAPDTEEWLEMMSMDLTYGMSICDNYGDNSVTTTVTTAGTTVATMWQPCGNYVATVWQLCDKYVASMWQLCGNYVATMWQLCGIISNFFFNFINQRPVNVDVMSFEFLDFLCSG